MRVSPLLAAALLFAACGPAIDSTPDTDSTEAGDITPTGKAGGLVGEAKPVGGATSNGIAYHGGPIMTGTKSVYVIWYGNWGNSTTVSIVTNFLSCLGGSPWFNICSTYTNSSGGNVTNSMVYGGSTTDSYSQGSALSDAQIQTVVSSAITTGRLPMNANGIYLVLTSRDVTASSGFCTQYCGWHTHGTISATDIKYAFIGSPARCPSSCSAVTTPPNGSVEADAMVSIIAHEIAEAATDPDLNAWYDTSGNENADKCAWTFGTSIPPAGCPSGSNFTCGGSCYYIQQNWVNASGGYCSMHYP